MTTIFKCEYDGYIRMKKLLKKLKKLFKQKKGFTLIELLVVIGILGILAAALVATIDPIEQLNKAQDANTKNILVEFLNGSIRYYANHNAYPWDSTQPTFCNSGNPPDVMPLYDKTTSTVSNCIGTLINVSELKPSFQSATGNLEQIYITAYGDATSGLNPSLPENVNSVVGCFKPISKSGQKATDVVWSQNGDSKPANCESAGGNTPCYWCTK